MYIGIDWPINSSITTSFGSLFVLFLICIATAIKEKKKIISEVKKKQINNKIASKKTLKEDKKISDTENKIKIKEKKIINKQQEALDVCQIIKECTIEGISRYLIKEGNKRDFPDITTRQ